MHAVAHAAGDIADDDAVGACCQRSDGERVRQWCGRTTGRDAEGLDQRGSKRANRHVQASRPSSSMFSAHRGRPCTARMREDVVIIIGLVVEPDLTGLRPVVQVDRYR